MYAKRATVDTWRHTKSVLKINKARKIFFESILNNFESSIVFLTEFDHKPNSSLTDPMINVSLFFYKYSI